MKKKTYPKTKCSNCGRISYTHPPADPCPKCSTGITKVLKKKIISGLIVVTVAIFLLLLAMVPVVLSVILVQ